MNLFSLLGWIGTVLYLLNHTYISYKTDWNHKIYYGANFLAAASLVISSAIVDSWQAVAINIFWALISLMLFNHSKLAWVSIRVMHFHFIIVIFMITLLMLLITNGVVDLAILGWLSAFVFSVAYLLFSIEKLPPRHYFLWNAFAAVSLLPQLWTDGNFPVFFLEIAWAIISIYGAIRRYSILRLID
jgi:hypothetical protein